MTHTSANVTRRPAENALGQTQDRQATSHQAAAPEPQGGTPGEPAPETPTTGIPPLPEPDIEGVGEESGPSAGTDTETLDRDQKKLARDGTGF